MTTSYYLILTDGTLDAVVPEGEALFTHGITFTGRSVLEYGLERNQNILHLVENFADITAPLDPVIGQFWYDKTVPAMKAWNGISWVGISTDDYVLDGTYPVNDITGEVTLLKNISGPVVISNAASENNLNAHITDLTDAHDASAISFINSGSIPSVETQGATQDVQNNLAAHIALVTGAHAASAISTTVVGSIPGPTTQLSIQQLQDEIVAVNSSVTTTNNNITAHIVDTVDAHDASAISYSNGVSGLTATNVQDAIDEINGNLGTAGSVDLTKVRQTVASSHSAVASKVTFNSVMFGDSFSQFNTGLNRYVAAFNQEVNVHFAFGIVLPQSGSVTMLEIRKNGSVVRSHQLWNFADSGSGPDLDDQVTVKLRLNAADYVEAFVSTSSGTKSSNTNPWYTLFEFEIVRVL